MTDKDLINSVFLPCLTNQRTPHYIFLDKYKDLLREPNKQLYLSSIRGADEWSYKFFLEFINNMTNGDKDYSAISLPYQFGVKAGVIGTDFVKQYMKNTIDTPEIAMAEMECVPIGGTADSFYKYKFINNCRDNERAMCVMSNEDYLSYKDKLEKWPFYQEKLPNEIRVMGVDIALIGGNENDATAIWIARLIPDNGKFSKNICYCSTMSGTNSLIQTLKIKRLFYETQCDYVAMDIHGNAAGIYDICTDETYDSERNITYPAWTVMNEEATGKYASRVISKNAVPVIYGVSTSSSEVLYRMIVNLKNDLESNNLHLLVDSQDVTSYLNSQYKYYKIEDQEFKSRILDPYVQTTRFVNEAVNLVSTV